MIDTIRIRPELTQARFDVCVDCVAKHFGVERATLLSSSRAGTAPHARHALYAVLYAYTSASLETIGARLNRHHATVLYGIRQTATWQAAYTAAYVAVLRELDEVLV